MDHTMIPMLCVQSESAKGGQVATLDRLMQDLKRYGGDRYAMEAKYDGFRLIVHRTADVSVKVYVGRNGSDYSGHFPILERHLIEALPPDTVLDGELLHKSGRGDIQSAAFTQARYVADDIMFVIFDVLRIGGVDARLRPWTERRAVLDGLDAQGKINGDQIRVSTLLPTAPSTLQALVDNNFEGCVVKRRASRYVNGRSSEWVKFKPQTTCEVEVIGFKPGKAGGSLDGMVGAFEVRLLENGALTTVKCGTMERHRDATDHPENWLHKIVEIKHMGIDRKSGVPLSPQFLRRRDDRQAPSNPLTPDMTGPHNSSQSSSTPDGPIADAPKPARPRRSSGPKMRNYGAMKDEKLLRSIGELQDGAGEAFDKVMARGGDPDEDLARARAIAAERGLVVEHA